MTSRAIVIGIVLFALAACSAQGASLLSESDTGFSWNNGNTYIDNYHELMDEMFSPSTEVIQTIDGDKMWVPWFSSSSQCQMSDLQSGGACNEATIDWTHNCMVTDEFSQVGILVSMGNDETRMEQFYNTVLEIPSSFGQIPAWRVYRDGSTIDQCRSGINGNCDTASDATARIIIALYTGSVNDDFSDSAQKSLYGSLAKDLTDDMIAHEIENTCYPSSLGHGDICYWLAAGSQARNGGMGSTDYGYTGYYADAIIALLMACSQEQDSTYCTIADHITLNYLEAAKWDGSSFSAPPGRSFRWENLGGIPTPTCTNGCSPVQWDDADAPRAFGMCQANFYAAEIGHTLPGLETYCDQWGQAHMNNPTSTPLQYQPDGTPASSQSGYFAQGLQALALSGAHDESLFDDALNSALGHYTTATQTWDWTACFGVYHQAFPMRALGFGIGRDLAVFGSQAPPPPPPGNNSNSTPPGNNTNSTPPGNNTNQTNSTPGGTDITFNAIVPSTNNPSIAEPDSQAFSVAINNPDNLPTSYTWLVEGANVHTNTGNSSSYTFVSDYDSAGEHTVKVTATSSQNTIVQVWTLVVSDTPQNNQSNSSSRPISFASTTPSATVGIDEPDDQTFSYQLINLDLLPTTTKWYLNGVEQTSSADQSSFTFLGSFATEGMWTIMVDVSSSINTITHQWILTVSDTTQTIAPTTEGAGGGGGGGGGGGAAPQLSEPGSVSGIGRITAATAKVVKSFFLGDTAVSTVELVDNLRDYFAEVEE